jgi:hypothetical protein
MYKVCWGKRAGMKPFSRFWMYATWRVLILSPGRLYGPKFIIRILEVLSVTVSNGEMERFDYR